MRFFALLILPSACRLNFPRACVIRFFFVSTARVRTCVGLSGSSSGFGIGCAQIEKIDVSPSTHFFV